MKFGKYAILVLVMGAMFTAGLFIGCKTFDPIRIENELDECNDMYTTMRFYVKSGIKSDGLIATMATKCNKSRERKRDSECLKWIFKDGKLDKKKYPEYAYYLECIK